MFGKVEFEDKKDLPEQAKIKLKWKTIQYLLENKKQQIDAFSDLLSNQKTTKLLQKAQHSNHLCDEIHEYKEQQLKNQI
jgi:hypothetical protein